MATLRKLTRGLLYMSESDAPFSIIRLEKHAGGFGMAEARLLAKRPADCPIQVQGLKEFFCELVQEQAWHGEEEKAVVGRYKELLEFFRGQVAEATVFRVGELQVDIIIIGKAADEGWVGVKTRAIET
jgi:hypothetical protein